MFSEYVQDSGHDLLMVFNRAGVYQDIIPIDATYPSSMRSLKMSFIMVWKEAGLLVGPKNMTRGSKRPQFVWKVAFHSSPSLIHTLLYPQHTSSFVKYLALESEIQLIMSGTTVQGAVGRCSSPSLH